MNLLKLFIVFFKIGSFTFGGGFAMIPLIKREVVDKQKWVGEKEFFDVISITQSLPGAVAINTSVFLGYKIRGVSGAAFSAVGVTLPSFLCILMIAAFFASIKKLKLVSAVFSGVNPIVVALITTAGIQVAKTIRWDVVNIAIFLLTILFVSILDIHPIIAIITLSMFSIVLKFLRKHYKKKGKQ
jgi:chromate transporter